MLDLSESLRYFAPDSYRRPDRFGKWVAGEVDTLDRLVKEFGLNK